MLKDYNGFGGDDRYRLSIAHRKAVADKTLPNPERCEMCSQTAGLIVRHNEDYDQPVKGAHALCVECYIRLRTRFFKPRSWQNWLSRILAGAMSKPYRRVSECCLALMGEDDPKVVQWENPRAFWYQRLSVRPLDFRKLPEDVKERLR